MIPYLLQAAGSLGRSCQHGEVKMGDAKLYRSLHKQHRQVLASKTLNAA